MGRIVDEKLLAVRLVHVIANRRRGGDNVEIKLSFNALLDDFHVQKSQETATEAKAERDGIVRLENQRRVVELQFQKRFLQIVKLTPIKRIDTAKDYGLHLFIPRAGRSGRTGSRRDRVPHGNVLNGFNRRRDIAYFPSF